jgi:hypothetical protein
MLADVAHTRTFDVDGNAGIGIDYLRGVDVACVMRGSLMCCDSSYGQHQSTSADVSAVEEITPGKGWLRFWVCSVRLFCP